MISKLPFLLCISVATGAVETPVPIPGWKIELVAAAPDILHPSVVCTAPDGRIFVAEDPMDISTRTADVREGRILCFHPDGRRTVFADKLHAVFGMQYLEGKLYVLHNPLLTVFTDGGDSASEGKDLIKQTNPNPWHGDWNDHIPANFRLAMDGFFYISTGDKGFENMTGTDGRVLDLREGGIIRMRPDGTGLEIVCRGIRNVLDLAINAEDEMFTYDNTDEHNWMGRFTHMVDGGFYGYPYDFVPQKPYTLWRMADYGAGAACGTLAWNNEALPESHRGSFIPSDFGQRNLRRVAIRQKGGTFEEAANENLIVDPPAKFRPVGIHETPDGRGIYVCDWQEADIKAQVSVGALWKLTWEKTEPQSRPAWWVALASGKPGDVTRTDLLQGLHHPLREVRLTAQRELARRLPATAPALQEILSSAEAGSRAKCHALWALGSEGVALISTGDKDPALRRQALRWLGENGKSPDAIQKVLPFLTSDDASLRRHAATALGRLGGSGEVPALLASLDQQDLFARFASFTALNRIGRRNSSAWNAICGGLSSSNPAISEGARFALRDTRDEALVASLIALLPSGSSVAAAELLADISMRRPLRPEYWGIHPALGAPPLKDEEWSATRRIFTALAGSLDDASAEVRTAVIGAFSGKAALAANPEIVPALRRAAESDPAVTVRIRALGALALGSEAELACCEENAAMIAGLLVAGTTPAPVVESILQLSPRIPGDVLTDALVARFEKSGLDGNLAKPLLTALAARKADAASPALIRAAASDSPLAAECVTALGAIASDRSIAGLRSLRKDLAPERQPAVVAALAATRNSATIPDLIAAWQDESLRAVALDGLIDLPDVRALDPLLAGLVSPQIALRERSRRSISTLGDQAWEQLKDRTTPLAPALVTELRVVFANRQEALDHPLLTPSTDASAKHTVADYDAYALEHPGDPWRGQQVFHDASRTACIACHAVGGHGSAIGPELDTIGSQFGRKALIESILYPSKTVRNGYEQVVIESTDGSTHLGAVRGEGPEHLVLVDLAGKSKTLPKKSVKSRQPIPVSLMPEGVHAAWTLEEFADLIAYVSSLKVHPLKASGTVPPENFKPLFNGNDLTGWKASPHWTVKDGLLQHDGVADDLWTAESFGDFELRLEWRFPDEPKFADHPVIQPDGHFATSPGGQPITMKVLEAGDSGVLLRGLYKAQANLFCYPIGSGEFWEYRSSATGEDRRSFTPLHRADRPIGQWNDMTVQLRGSTVTVTVNGKTVIENTDLPGLPSHGPIGLQHEHGTLQFRNIHLKPL